MQWNILNTNIKMHTPPFNVEELLLEDKINNEKYTYYRLQSPDWVNICPIDKYGNIILIEQSRAGAFNDIIELPGGVVEAEENIEETVKRELEEETGFITQKIIHLQSINPNPAIMTNKLHMFLAIDCTECLNRKNFPDSHEYIKVFKIPSYEIENLIHTNKIGSALSLLTLMLALNYLQKNK